MTNTHSRKQSLTIGTAIKIESCINLHLRSCWKPPSITIHSCSAHAI